MNPLIVLSLVHIVVAQLSPFTHDIGFQQQYQGRGIFPSYGRPVGHPAFGGRQDGFASAQAPVRDSGRSYQVKGRLLCGVQGEQGAKVSLYEIGDGGTPIVYEGKVVDGSGSFQIKADIRDQELSGGGPAPLHLAINHNCGGVRHMSLELPLSYLNEGLDAIKTFDIGIINLEARYSGEKAMGINAAAGGMSNGDNRGKLVNLRNGNSGGGFAPFPAQDHMTRPNAQPFL